ncbi:helix-turn-helix domain-containing protein [Paenibacillus sp. IB182496]|uniref:Helix-turn-helix domain-containing protein n=1 Tax=Paenibacillus sabuli TaxID=2772509 RepID=A0A927BPJ1_9BACL|nr:helix-turn-helix domain-containing protein [Paenibacillus sabuli]MBD2844362.1 helix-turn-helix domain-containing protein [Paenibacillus sabuli]
MKLRRRLFGVPANRSGYFRKLIWLVCLLIYIPILLAGIAYYQLSVPRLTEELKARQLAGLGDLMARMEDQLAAVEYGSLQFSSSALVRDSFLRPDFDRDYLYHGDMLDSMTIRKNTHAAVHELIYYNAASDLVLSNEYGYVPGERYPLRGDLAAIMAGGRPAGWTYLPEAGKQGLVSFVRLLPVHRTGAAEGAVIIQIKEADMARELRGQSVLQEQARYLIADAARKVLFHSSDKSLPGTDLSGDPVFARIAGTPGSAGLIHAQDASGEETLVFFRRTVQDRLYVAMVPEAVIAAQLGWVKTMIGYTTAIVLLLGGLLSYIGSRVVYNPVERLIRQGRTVFARRDAEVGGNEFDYLSECLSYMHEQSESLRRHLHKLEPTLREQFLARLVKGRIPQARDIERERERLGLIGRARYLALVVMPEKLYKETRFLPEEAPVVAFAIANVAKELLAKHQLQGEVIVGDEAESIVLLHDDDLAERDAQAAAIHRYAEAVCEALEQYMSFSVSIGAGGWKEGLLQVPASYREALLALQCRLFRSGNSVNYYDGDSPKKQPLFAYPRELEGELLDRLLRGDGEGARAAMHAFAEAIRVTESYNLIHQSCHVLLSSIIRSLEAQGIGLLDIMENNWFEQLKSRQTMDEIVDWFLDVLFPLYGDILAQSRKLSGRAAVQKVWQHVKDNIGETVSLTECAELVGMSPSYLSRQFRKEAGIAFVDFVMSCKVEEAKRLLRDTERSVQDIAQEVGYSERNLNRVFQRLASMSPGQFRASER